MQTPCTGPQLSKKNLARSNPEAGFSLIEMIVSVGLFAIVMVICVATLFALVNANRKAQALQSVINNLNITLDGMARAIRMGHTYHCGSSGQLDETQDCPTGDPEFVFESHDGSSSDGSDQWVYFYDSASQQIWKSEDSGANAYPVTAPEIKITDMKFYVRGTESGCDAVATPCIPIQPSVVVVVNGTAASDNAKASTSFHIQVAAVQRIIDI